jgi:hypothetical protein
VNRHERRAVRAAGRKTGPTSPPTQAAQRVRVQLLAASQREVHHLSETLDREAVIAICDSRDPVAREWLTRVSGMTEGQIKEREAPMILGRMIPTFFLSVPREQAIDLTALNSPRVSETIETLGATLGRVVLVIAAGGTMLHAIQTRDTGSADLQGEA